MEREFQKEIDGSGVFSSNETLRSVLFRGGLESAYYKVYLYKEGDGYEGEVVTLKVDEFAGTGQVDHDIYIVHNSHGTDSDSTYSRGPVMTLAQTADLIQAILDRDTESEFTYLYPEGKRGTYNPEFPTLISRLRQADRMRAAILQAGKAVVDAYVPAYTVKELCYASATSVVLAATSPNEEDCVIKLNRVSKVRTVIEKLFCEDPGFSENGGLVPIWILRRIPVDETADILLTVMPRLNSIRLETVYEAGKAPKSWFNLHHLYRDELLSCGEQIALGLQSLHKRGIIHNDVKPENIFYKETGTQTTWYLGDWDSLIEEEQLHPGNTIRLHNTLSYSAPEVRRREFFSYNSDIYSWGITMLALLFNVVPDDISAAEIIKTDDDYIFCGERIRRHFYSSNKFFVDFLCDVVLQENPAKRCTDADELLRDLENLEFRIPKTMAARKASTDEKNMAALAQQKKRSSNRKVSDNTWGNDLLELLLPRKFVVMLIGLIVFLVIVAIITKIL